MILWMIEAFPEEMDARIVEAVKESFSIDTLYSHQSEGLRLLQEGKSIIITTSTSRYASVNMSL
jgi:ATP-dependent helicase YprA (DUF1998 family)